MDALHATRGHWSTPARRAAWLQQLGLSAADDRSARDICQTLPDTSLEGLAPTAGATAAERLAAMYSQSRVQAADRQHARIVFHELGQPYPLKVEQLLTAMTREFNATRVNQAMADVCTDIAAAAPDEGLLLVERVEKAVAAVRAKDALALTMAVLITLYDSAVARAEAEHLRVFGAALPPAQETLLRQLLDWHCAHKLTDRALADVDGAALRQLLAVPPGEPVTAATVAAYLTEALATRAVARRIAA